MENLLNWINVGVAVIGGVISWFFGEIDGLLYTLVAFVVVDYFTGVLRAIVEKNLSSSLGAKGISKKVIVFLLVGIANLLDTEIFKADSVLRSAVIFFYIANEGISIFENSAFLGLPVPEKIKDALLSLKSAKEDGKSDR